ncbi:hypothetical protein DMJ13_20460 [halophilic archaeon]|nr:hypothetical protein DMJ13_20460 [halophilic archaeon]
MHEPNGRDGRNGRKRLLSTRLNARVLATLVLAVVVVLAGCTGIGGLSGDGDTADATSTASGTNADGGGSGDGADTDASDGTGADASAGDGAGSTIGEDSQAEDNWFNLSKPGHYEFDLAGMDEETGKQVTGRLVYDVEVAGAGELTTSVDYEFGSEQFQSTTTGPAEEFSAQLFLNEAYAPIAALQSVSLMYLFEMGFTDPTVGNRKQSTTDEGTQITEVTEKRTYAGLECFFVETTLDGEVTQQSCIRGMEGGIAPYAATHTDEGELELEVELVEYESN